MIEQVQADLMVLQEVGSLKSLQTLNDMLSAPFAYCDLIPGNSDRSIHIGVLSRSSFSLTSHRERVLLCENSDALMQVSQAGGTPEPARVQRDILQIDTSIHSGQGTGQLTLFAVHLKSRINQAWQIADAQTIRGAEVRLLTELVTQFLSRHPQALLAVLGDFNDQPDAEVFASLNALGLADPHGEWARARGFNPTTYWPKRKCRFDRILLNPAAAAHLVEDSAMMHSSRMAQQASDHYPVSLTLEFQNNV